jgi:(E)-4-hydroxy-3-methylbut-2-enyl-diphosphate synthase
MCATRTQDVAATLNQIKKLQEHGADLIRVAVDSKKDVDALAEIRRSTDARLVVDLQESYRLVEKVAPFVEKVRYNPGHLHHHEKEVPVLEKVRFIVEHASKHSCAVRIGVNFGSLDPAQSEGAADPREAALSSAGQHIEYMKELGFTNYLVSLKSSDPNAVIDINRAFAERFAGVPLHLGVTEAGMLPDGEIKSRIAFEQLLARGIGDTLRVSLTLPFDEKYREILIGRKIVEDVQAGRFRSVPRFEHSGLNIISCPSCSRVENEAFVELASKVKEMAQFAADQDITIAVMGCRVNGPGETDEADLGLWCAPRHVNLKKGGELLGAFSYDEILPRVQQELEALIAGRS